MVGRKRAVAQVASPAITAVRQAYCVGGSDTQRVAALVEVAGAAAALARTVCRYRAVDRVELFDLVSRPVDVLPVLGRGQWLPTMTFHVAAPVASGRRAVGPVADPVGMLPLFTAGGAA